MDHLVHLDYAYLHTHVRKGEYSSARTYNIWRSYLFDGAAAGLKVKAI